MATPPKGSAKWTETKLHEIAAEVENGNLKAAEAKALCDIYREAHALRIARAAHIRANEDPEEYIRKAESGELQQPDLRLIENG